MNEKEEADRLGGEARLELQKIPELSRDNLAKKIDQITQESATRRVANGEEELLHRERNRFTEVARYSYRAPVPKKVLKQVHEIDRREGITSKDLASWLHEEKMFTFIRGHGEIIIKIRSAEER